MEAVKEYYDTLDEKVAKSEWIKIQEDGKPLWQFHRGAWRSEGLRIVDVKIGEDGITLWIKVGPRRD